MRNTGFLLITIFYLIFSSEADPSEVKLLDDVLEVQNITSTGYASNPESCLDIKSADQTSSSGLYTIYSKYGKPYDVFCEMDTVGGGWTLVASVHENRIYTGCTAGDRWSNENGAITKYGESNWENVNTFGLPEYAASDDYKNRGYFEIEAKRFMMIQVPNDTPMEDFVSEAKYISYTPTAFLSSYGGNFRELFKTYQLRDATYTKDIDNGPSVQMSFVKGDATSANNQYWSGVRAEIEPGFVQFRAVTNEQAATAFCPYGKMRPGGGQAEYLCFGTSYIASEFCNDFSYMHYSSSLEAYAFLILYR